MSTSGEAADQVVQICLNGTNTALRITGEGAIDISRLIMNGLKSKQYLKSRKDLEKALSSKEKMNIYTVEDTDLFSFCTEAKRYGVDYQLLRDPEGNKSHILVKDSDKMKINRIFSSLEKKKSRTTTEKETHEEMKKNKDFSDLLFSENTDPSSARSRNFQASGRSSKEKIPSLKSLTETKSVRDLISIFRRSKSVVLPDGTIEKSRKRSPGRRQMQR